MVDIKNMIIIAAGFLMLWLLIRYKRAAVIPFVFALFVALAWTSYYRYQYVGENIFLFNQINLYPFVLWTVGLTGLQLIHFALERRYGTIVTIALYLIALAALEAFGYHVLKIRLVTNYTSLLGLGIIHAPLVMKIFYILAGPTFILFMRFMRIEKTNPKQTIQNKLGSLFARQ